MRVLMVGAFPYSPDRVDGGVSAAMTYLSQSLVHESGIDLIGIRIVGKGRAGQSSGDLGFPIEDLSLDRGSLSSLFLRQRKQFRSQLARYHPDIVHAHGVDLPGLLAVGCGMPAVVTVHGLLGECAKYQTNPLMKARDVLQGLLTEKYTIRRATDIIAISPYVARYYSGDLQGRVHEIPNAVGPSFFAVRRAPERGRFLFAGRISKGKGVLELVQAVARIPQHVRKVILAGSTPDKAYEGQVRAEIQKFGLTDRVQFAGLLGEQALLDEFSSAEALVLPSYQETAPMVVQQAMAAGLAVIATRVGGIPDQIEHNLTGLMFDAGDVGALADAMARIHDEPSVSSRMGACGKVVAAERYRAASVASKTRAVYEAIIGHVHAGQRAG